MQIKINNSLGGFLFENKLSFPRFLFKQSIDKVRVTVVLRQKVFFLSFFFFFFCFLSICLSLFHSFLVCPFFYFFLLFFPFFLTITYFFFSSLSLLLPGNLTNSHSFFVVKMNMFKTIEHLIVFLLSPKKG